MISIHKKYQTREGRPVELVTTGGRGKWPVLGYVGTPVEWNLCEKGFRP